MSHPSDDTTSIVLMADDDEDDCVLAREAIEENGSHILLYCVEDGIELMEHLLNVESLPSFILLDLNMPRKDGRQALKEIKSSQAFKHIPVVIFTTSQEEKDIAFSQKMGADFFFTKPAHFSEWVDIMKHLMKNYLRE